MEPIPALNQLMKESHKYILTMYADGSYLHILLQHTEQRGTIVADRLPIQPTQASLEEAVSLVEEGRRTAGEKCKNLSGGIYS